MNFTETLWSVEDSKKVDDLVDASAHEVPEADWDIAMAEITAHLLTAYRGFESLPAPAVPREALVSFVAASRFLSAALVAMDEGCIAVWSNDASGTRSESAVLGYPTAGRKRLPEPGTCASRRARRPDRFESRLGGAEGTLRELGLEKTGVPPG